MGLTVSINDAQEDRVLRMTAAMRNDLVLLEYVLGIKQAFAADLDDDALALWKELNNEEMSVLWIAPKYGGIFTTDERKRLRP